jgi:hypothetical protein
MRVIGAAIAGYVAIGVLVICTDQLYALLVPGFKSMPMLAGKATLGLIVVSDSDC